MTSQAAASPEKEPLVPAAQVEVRPLLPGEDAAAFRTLNEEWIARHFTLEPKDIATLNEPESTILRKGGQVFLLYLEGAAIGCVALEPLGGGVYELSKMAVTPHLRGRGYGRLLLGHAIAHARLLGARSLFLGSSTKLPSAVGLYQSMGFQHVPPETLPPMPYARVNVWMELAFEERL